jgi:hypothetical protein
VEGATKSVEIEFLKEDFVALIELMVRDEDGETNMGLLTAKVNDAFAVATSMVVGSTDSRVFVWFRNSDIVKNENERDEGESHEF